MYFAYILQSKKDQSFYTGHTDNIERRIKEHNCGKNKYTRNKAPWLLVKQETFLTRSEAMRRERQIKKMKSSKYIKDLIGSID
ncbi:MAG: GIY-YIG nuclease family protein [Patescibacteria group bacterium]|nr:GIY-YIG nuclease family protein [Patescibacteria group bacterium]MDD4611239.1 GIY-YIG nuclease family protein [Patescibacteria group bacterium]